MSVIMFFWWYNYEMHYTKIFYKARLIFTAKWFLFCNVSYVSILKVNLQKQSSGDVP